MREKDNGEKLLDMLASMSLSYDVADDTYQLAGEAVCELDDVKEENVALKKRIAELLEQAAEDIQEWGAYASAYFQEKHNLAANVAKYREAARRLLEAA